MMYKFVTALVLFCVLTPASAQEAQTLTLDGGAQPPSVRELNWLNEQFLIKQRNRLDKIFRENFGRQLQVGEANMPLLQRLINENIIPSSDTLELQAMGVILGDVFVARNRNLSWRVYHDDLGKSHAVCVDDSAHCLFPVTMLSRRIEVGIKPNVEEIYDKGLSSIKPFLPKLPFSE